MASFINNMKEKLHHKKQSGSAQQADSEQQQQTQPSNQQQQPMQSDNQQQQPVQSNEQQQEPTQSNDEQQGSGGDSSDPEGGLSAHNKAREQKGAKPLQWSNDLAQDAEKYAQKLAEMNKMEHAGVEGQGENLFMSTGDASYEQAVQSWLDEEQKYNGEKVGDGNFMEWGHFSQCLWHSTTHVGMGKGQSKDGATYIVARYTPQGNMAGEKPF